ncbi:unnamed protein product [Brassica rapa]|uniref:Holin n=2 Tax=Brassica campestris TaxID=3711 RepID=A0A8D9HM73_BRACM|nr:unnamed protein product [Brassica rapa]
MGIIFSQAAIAFAVACFFITKESDKSALEMIKDKETIATPSEAVVISLATVALYAAHNNPGEAATKVLIGVAIKAIKPEVPQGQGP